MEKLNYTVKSGRKYKLPEEFYAISGRFGDSIYNHRNENVTHKVMLSYDATSYIIHTDNGIAHLELLN